MGEDERRSSGAFMRFGSVALAIRSSHLSVLRFLISNLVTVYSE